MADMGKLKNFVRLLHKATSRNYIERMVNNKVECMLKAKEYELITGTVIASMAETVVNTSRVNGSL